MKNDRKKEKVSEDETIRDRDPEPETGPKYPARAGKGLFRRRRIRPEATAVYAGPDYFASIEEVYAGPTVTGVYAGPTMMPVYAGPRMARVYAGPAFFVKPAGKEAATSEGGADKSADSKTGGPAFFCPSCGSKLESITKFCPECGADLRKPGGGPVSI